MMWKAQLMAVAVSCCLISCDGDTSCKRACKHLSSCRSETSGSGTACQLSAECRAEEKCQSECWLAASCEAITGKNDAEQGLLSLCLARCLGQTKHDAAPPSDGVREQPRGEREPNSDQTAIDAPLAHPDRTTSDQETRDRAVVSDQRAKDKFVAPDQRARDKLLWPDHQARDVWPWPSDGYSSTPFGCSTDTDCFGQICCPTPWGVKMCATTCAFE